MDGSTRELLEEDGPDPFLKEKDKVADAMVQAYSLGCTKVAIMKSKKPNLRFGDFKYAVFV